VLDNGQHVGGSSHSDQITLMVNIDDTSCFGYHETGSSTQHNNKAALVSWQTIRDWANENGLNGNCLADDWNRSFLGFDLAIKEGAQAYATDEAGNVQYADYSQAPESPKYAWDGEKVIEIADPNKYWPIEYYDDYKTIKKGGESIGWLTTNENFYVAADKITLSQTISINRAQLTSISEIQNCVVLKEVMDGDQWYQAVLNLPKIQQLVNDGYLPVKDNSLTEWVKVGKSDGYFSDWIVTLTEATREVPSTPTYRVIAEDLSVGGEETDFDFNDVVFDVEPNAEGTAADIIVVAAGGIYQLEVAGVEVHEALGCTADADGLYPMINTGDGPTKDPKKIATISGNFSNDEAIRQTIKNISIYVWKPQGGDKTNIVKCPIEATTGQPAGKILVDKNFPVVPEHHSIANEHSNFRTYVRGSFDGDTWW
jgi:hypothetical protein